MSRAARRVVLRSALRTRLCLATVMGSGLFLTPGCDQEAANRGEAARLLTQAIDAIREADTAQPSGDGSLMSQARLTLLEPAIAPLEEAAMKGSPSQKAQALILLARIDAQAGEALARSAANANAQARLTISNLLAELATVDALAATALTAQRDPSAAIAQMDEAIAATQARRDDLAQRVDRFQARLDELNGTIEAEQATARAAFTEKNQLETKAFALDGKDKYQTLAAATSAQRRADAADVTAQALQIDLNQVQQAFDLAQRELDLVQDSADQFMDTRDAFEQAGQTAEQTVRDLKAQQAQRTEQFVAELQAVADTFAADVAQPMSAAVDRLQSAVDHADRAGSGLSGAERNHQRTEHLDKLHLLVQTLANATQYHEDMQASLKAIAGRSAFDDAAELSQALTARAAELGEAADTFRARATETLAAARTQLENMNAEDELVLAVRDAVNRIESQLNAG